MKAGDFFSDAEKAAIRDCILEAESRTSGEIRVHIENKCSGDPVKRAGECFGRLGMHKTAARNGILFYLAVDSRVFAVFGDSGIHEKADEGFWTGISARMENYFREGKFTAGLCEGIREAGMQLQRFFPAGDQNPDELPNEISFQ